MKYITGALALILTLFFLIVLPSYLPERTGVVVIGSGAAGMRAALECRRHTDRVVLLEKMPYPGGNSNRASAGFNAVTEGKDRDVYIMDTQEAGGYRGKAELIRILAEKSADALYDLKFMGADLEDRGLLAGHSVSRTYRPSGGSPVGREVSSVLNNAVRSREIDLRLENRALSIRKKRKWDVLVTNRTGKEYTIRADAVVIATGGFGGNPQFVAAYNPQLKGFHTTNSAGASGDYIKLTEDLPVQLVDMDEIQTHPTVEPEFSTLITEALRGNGGILVNSQGERFTNEMDFREDLSRSILKQRDGYAWLIFDQNVRESLKASEFYIENELTQSGESAEELAEGLALPEGRLSPDPGALEPLCRGGSRRGLQQERPQGSPGPSPLLRDKSHSRHPLLHGGARDKRKSPGPGQGWQSPPRAVRRRRSDGRHTRKGSAGGKFPDRCYGFWKDSRLRSGSVFPWRGIDIYKKLWRNH